MPDNLPAKQKDSSSAQCLSALGAPKEVIAKKWKNRREKVALDAQSFIFFAGSLLQAENDVYLPHNDHDLVACDICT